MYRRSPGGSCCCAICTEVPQDVAVVVQYVQKVPQDVAVVEGGGEVLQGLHVVCLLHLTTQHLQLHVLQTRNKSSFKFVEL